jgi:hypothetical protein
MESPRNRLQAQIRNLQHLELLICRQYELCLQSPEVPRNVFTANRYFASLLISAVVFFPKIDDCDRLWCGSKEVSGTPTANGTTHYYICVQQVND